MKAYVFLAPGFEEGEAVSTADILQRAGIDVCLTSIDDTENVTGARGFTIRADSPFSGTDFSDGDIFFIPGGVPGADNLANFAPLGAVLKQAQSAGKTLCAICAGPMVFQRFELLTGVMVTSHSSVRDTFDPAYYSEAPVVKCGNIYTGRGLAWALDLGLTIVENLISVKEANRISLAIENGAWEPMMYEY